jgi:uncharacterized BrkB/YihY/UPF0761 family membrane protein
MRGLLLSVCRLTEKEQPMTFTLSIHSAHHRSTRRKLPSSCWLLGALFGIGGGLLATLLVPSLSLCAWWMSDAQLSHLSTLIAYAALPLLLLGASCLDWYEKAERKNHA